jgi:hypothetical protein
LWEALSAFVTSHGGWMTSVLQQSEKHRDVTTTAVPTLILRPATRVSIDDLQSEDEQKISLQKNEGRRGV